MIAKLRYFLLPFLFFVLLFTSCKKAEFKITFDTLGGSLVATQKVKKKDKVLIPQNPNKEGYSFGGWYTTPSCTEKNKYDFNNSVNHAFTLYAKWNKLEYTIEYDLDGGFLDGYYPKNFSTDEYVELPVPTKKYYQFLGWYENDELVQRITNKNYQLVAKWQQVECIVEFMLDEETLFASQVVGINEKVLLPSIPKKEGYIFQNWMIEGKEFDNNMPVTEHLRIYANWEKQKFTVDFTTFSDTIIEPVEVVYGEKLPIPATPEKAGYDFVGWYSTGLKYDFNQPVTSSLTLAAEWEMKKEALDAYLQSLVPSTITTNLELVSYLRYCSASFIWSSSNSKVLTDDGIVKRLSTDVNLTFSVEVVYSDKQYRLDFSVFVPKISLKPFVNGQIVSGYLYDSGGFKDLPETALEQLDYINYSFALISNGEVYIPSNMNVDKVLAYRDKGVRVGLAIGGWGAGGFSPAVKTATGRTKLIDSIMKLIDQYQFDGIDIDWEYPTTSVAGIESDPSDKNNFTLFCQELKTRMQAYREDLVLSIAIAASTRYYDLPVLNNFVDIFNLMTYDYAMGTIAQHNSSLYSVTGSQSSIDANVRLVSQYVDSNKIIIGSAFYVRRGTFNSEVNQTIGSPLKTSMASNSISYATLVDMIQNDISFIEQYDENAKAAYIICDNVFYSYDNSRSIRDKCEYIKAQGLAGIMCWQLSQDYIDENSKSVLISAMYESIK